MVESMFTSTVCATGFLIALTLRALSRLGLGDSIFQYLAKPDIPAVSLSDFMVRLKQTAPDSWNSPQFDPARWEHYALIVVFIGISSWGLWLSWCWNQEKRQSKVRASLMKESRKGENAWNAWPQENRKAHPKIRRKG